MALSVWQGTIRDDAGDALPAASVTVRREHDGALAALFIDRDGTTPATNPITADGDGFARLYAAGGTYRIDAQLGAFSRTWRHVAMGLLAERDFITQSQLAPGLYPVSNAEEAAEAEINNMIFPPGNVLRYVPSEAVPLIEAGNGADQVPADITAGAQDALDSYRKVHFPAGTYVINGALKVRPWSIVRGDGKAEYVECLNEAATGTRIIQTTGSFIIDTDIGPDLGAAFPGRIVIQDITLLGGTIASPPPPPPCTTAPPIGTYGVRGQSSNNITLERVKAEWFTLSGIRMTGSLLPHIVNCEANYNQDSGIRLDLGPLGLSEQSNSYLTVIAECRLHQNKDCGIRLGDSTVRVTIRDCDIESTGSFFGSGAGVGIFIAGESRTVSIQGCWLEGNKNHIVLGSTGSTVTVPKNTRIADCQFWSINGAGAKVVLNAGRDTLIENCEFAGGGTILLNSISDNPTLRGNLGNPQVLDSNNNPVSVDCQDMENLFPYPAISSWTLTNCAVDTVAVPSPAGGSASVYRVTPTATGFVRIASPETVMAFLKERQTIGCYLRTGGPNRRIFDWNVASTNMSKAYCSDQVDNFSVSHGWEWHSIGRHIDASDTGNQAVFLSVTVSTTDPFYITGFSSRRGICYLPYERA